MRYCSLEVHHQLSFILDTIQNNPYIGAIIRKPLIGFPAFRKLSYLSHLHSALFLWRSRCLISIYFQMRPLLSLTTVLAIIFCSVSSLKFRAQPNIQKSLRATVGSANLDWPNLGFEYSATESFVKCEYKNGEWGEVKLESDPYVKIHIGATALHYGQACFEGMKAFHTESGKVCIFRPTENADRIARSSRRVCMPPLPEEKFINAMKLVVRENLAYVPVR